jgi:hypothetical protein
MTLLSIRTALTLCLAASLAACGGGGSKATFVVGGTVLGLAYPGLKLTSGDQNVTVDPVLVAGVAQNVPYAFPKTIEYGTTYTVAVAQSPAKQSCSVVAFGTDGANRDSAGHTATINVAVTCTTYSYAIGGKINGLTGAGLVLTNGSDPVTVAPAAAATTFTFTNPVLVDVAYGVSVLAQPAGQTCTVANGTGIMPNNLLDASSANPITVNCVNNTPT